MSAFVDGKKSDGLKVTSCGFLRRRVSKPLADSLLWRCGMWGEDGPMHLGGTWCHWGQQRCPRGQESCRLPGPEGWSIPKANRARCAIHLGEKDGRSQALQQAAVVSLGFAEMATAQKFVSFLPLMLLLTNCNFTLRKKEEQQKPSEFSIK